MTAILPVLTGIPLQPQISFMNKCRWLQGVPRIFLNHLMRCLLTKLTIDKWQQLLGCIIVTSFNIVKDARNINGLGRAQEFNFVLWQSYLRILLAVPS